MATVGKTAETTRFFTWYCNVATIDRDLLLFCNMWHIAASCSSYLKSGDVEKFAEYYLAICV